MTKETERGIKLDFYRECKEKAVNCLTAMGAKTKDGCVDEHSWECLMQLHSDVKRRSTNEDERSAADLAAWAREVFGR